MIGDYLVVALVFGIAVSFVAIIHHFWLRDALVRFSRDISIRRLLKFPKSRSKRCAARSWKFLRKCSMRSTAGFAAQFP